MTAMPITVPPRRGLDKPPASPNDLLLDAIGQILRRNPSATEHAVRTTLYAKHPDAARILAKTPTFEHEAKIVDVAMRLCKERAERKAEKAEAGERRRAVWIG